MSSPEKSLLLVSEDAKTSNEIQSALRDVKDLHVRLEATTPAGLNGEAVKLAAQNPIVIFVTDPSNRDDLEAIRSLSAHRNETSAFLALTSSDIPLSRARELSDAGVDDVLPFPMPEEQLRHQIENWIARVGKKAASDAPRNDGAVIAVAPARGGIGSSTVAVNLADHLVGRKSRFKKEPMHRVAILDLDVQFGTVGDFLDVDGQEAMMHLATDGILPDASWLESSLVEVEPGLSVLSAPTRFIPLDAITSQQIEALLVEMRKSFDYVVVDLPRALVSWIEPVISHADRMLIVTDSTVPSVRASRRLIDFFTDDNPGLAVEVIMNHEKRPFVLAHHHKEAERVLEHTFEHWLPSDPGAARKAIDYGKPLSQVAPRSDLTKAIGKLAKATMAAMPAVAHAAH